jgi:DNA-binding NarL/FixJ family response regulator
VVLAEDHPAMATELHELLSADYDIVEIVHDGAALIEAAGGLCPDAIVCDIAMPRVNGLAPAASIRATRPDARIVFVTVQDSRAVIRRPSIAAHEGTSSKATLATNWWPPYARA